MINFISGILREKEEDFITVECGGVGFNIFVTNACSINLPALDEDVKIYTYMVVKEDELTLYGFVSPEEKRLFLQLISVSGVGPKTAIQILSAERMNELVSSIVNEDVKVIGAIKGIGKKTAERIVLELKDKIRPLDYILPNEAVPVVGNPNIDDAVMVLTSLGQTKAEATRLAREVALDDDTAETIVAKVLHNMAR